MLKAFVSCVFNSWMPQFWFQRSPRPTRKMNLFRRARSRSPSIPKLCIRREKVENTSGDSSTASFESTTEISASLEVPSIPRMRSSSFDASSLQQEDTEVTAYNTLAVPTKKGSSRSRSFDSACSSDDISDRESYSLKVPGLPKYYRRRSLDIPRLCIHCVHLESLSSQEATPASPSFSKQFSYSKTDLLDFDFSDSSSGSACSSGDEDEDTEGFSSHSCSIEITDADDPLVQHKSPKQGLQRQFSFDEDDFHQLTKPTSQNGHLSRTNNATQIKGYPNAELRRVCSKEAPTGQTVLTLMVPSIKTRSSSMDGRIPSPTEERCNSFDSDVLTLPTTKQQRSNSIDVSLPTDEQHHYQAVHRNLSDSFK